MRTPGLRAAAASFIVMAACAPMLAARAGDRLPAHESERPCESCHALTAGTSHPIGVVARMPVPPDLPLDRDGRVTCQTCHDVAGPGLEGRPPAAFLLRRGAEGTALCQACHRAGLNPESRLSHAILIGSAHGGAAAARTTQPPAAAGMADSRSLQCMGCHDGSIAASDNMTIAGLGASGPAAPSSPGALGLTHPIGADYALLAMTRGDLQPMASLQHGAVRLVDGKVGCTSCHSPFSTRASLLVMTNDRSGLCLRCHRL